MKAIKLLLAYVLVAGAATLAFGGPGPDYMLRTKQAEKAKAQATIQAKAQAVTQVATCGACGCAAMKKS